jgi:hypothetical protein
VRRHLLNLFTATSLLLLAPAVGFWVRSYAVRDELEWVTRHVDASTGNLVATSRTYFHSSRGWWAQGDYTDDPDAVVTRGRSTPVQAHTVFFWRRDPNTPPLLFWATRFGGQVPVPYWATCLALAALPAARAAARWLRRPDRSPGPGFDVAPARDRSPVVGVAAMNYHPLEFPTTRRT